VIKFILSDDTDSREYTLYETPFVDKEVEGGEEEITTLNGNVYVDFIYTKRIWERTFSVLSQNEYLALNGFQDIKRTTYKFPYLSIPEFGIDRVPVYLKISERNTINACGMVTDISLIMRETVQQ